MADTTQQEMEAHVQAIVGPSLASLEAVHQLIDTDDMAKHTADHKTERVATAKALTNHNASACTLCLNFKG